MDEYSIQEVFGRLDYPDAVKFCRLNKQNTNLCNSKIFAGELKRKRYDYSIYLFRKHSEIARGLVANRVEHFKPPIVEDLVCLVQIGKRTGKIIAVNYVVLHRNEDDLSSINHSSKLTKLLLQNRGT